MHASDGRASGSAERNLSRPIINRSGTVRPRRSAMGLAALLCLATVAPTLAEGPRFGILNGKIKQNAAAMFPLMTFSVVPDLTTSSLSIQNASTGAPSLSMTQLGAGATLSKPVPIDLEGSLAYSRYDPKVVATDGQERSLILRGELVLRA